MKKKIYFTILVATGVLGYSFSLNNVAFASLVCDSSSNYCTSVWKEKGYPDINVCKQEQASCLSGLPGQCISAYGPNAVVVGGGSEKENTIKSCSCQSGYVGDNNGYCRTPDEITKIAQCHSSNGSYSRGVCICQDSYQLVNGQCTAQTVLDAQKKTEEDARNTQNTPQCVAIRGENAEYKNFQCGCKDGYQIYIGNKCQTATEACQSWYGSPSRSTTADSTTCTCLEGYLLSDKRCIPLAQPVSIIPATVSPPAPVTVLLPPVPTVIPKPIITTPTKKKPQPSTESEVKTPPLSEITATTTRQEQITTSPTEAPEIVRPVPAPIVKQENVFQRVWRKFLSWF